MVPLSDLLLEVDRLWVPISDGRVCLRIIGASALMLQTSYNRGTKDGDVLETDALAEPLKRQLLTLAGENSSLHQKHRMYIQIVASGLPFLPQPPLWRRVVELSHRLHHFDVEALDVVDVVISKLFRFSANDQADIAAMIDLDLVDHPSLVERFVNAMERFEGDARAEEELPACIENLKQVERDFLQVAETLIELPRWMRD